MHKENARNRLHDIGYFIVSCCLLLFPGGCQPETASQNDQLIYRPASAASTMLLAEANLMGSMTEQTAKVTLEFSNRSEKSLVIDEMILSTPEGLRSQPINIRGESIVLPLLKDTLLSLLFQPVNDLSLYQLTGMHGMLKMKYHLDITYRLQEEKEKQHLRLSLCATENQYRAYEKLYRPEVFIYTFNTRTNFAVQQAAYIKNAAISTSSFCHVSDQEIMVSGLNIRLKAYQLRDSLYVNLTFVNHAVFTVKLNQKLLDVYGKITNSSIHNVKNVPVNNSDYELLMPGDRISVTFKKNVNDLKDVPWFISLRNSVLTHDGKQLLADDVPLAKSTIENVTSK